MLGEHEYPLARPIDIEGTQGRAPSGIHDSEAGDIMHVNYVISLGWCLEIKTEGAVAAAVRFNEPLGKPLLLYHFSTATSHIGKPHPGFHPGRHIEMRPG